MNSSRIIPEAIIILALMFSINLNAQESTEKGQRTFPYLEKCKDSLDYNFELIDAHVDSIGYNFDDIDDLIAKVTKASKNDLEKTRSIFYWIAKNIRYDEIGLRSSFWDTLPFNEEMALKTLEKRKGICSGYSLLFKLMLDKLEIEASIVTGNGKTGEATIINNFSNHAWNAVNIDGVWRLLDVTWASPKSENGIIEDFYFLTSPNRFIATHFPDDEKWTLLENDITKEDYESFPQVGDRFFNLGFGEEIPLIERDGNIIRFDLSYPESIMIGFTIMEKGSYQNEIIDFKSTKFEDETEIEIKLPDDKDYEIEMTAVTGDPLIKLYGVMYINK